MSTIGSNPWKSGEDPSSLYNQKKIDTQSEEEVAVQPNTDSKVDERAKIDGRVQDVSLVKLNIATPLDSVSSDLEEERESPPSLTSKPENAAEKFAEIKETLQGTGGKTFGEQMITRLNIVSADIDLQTNTIAFLKNELNSEKDPEKKMKIQAQIDRCEAKLANIAQVTSKTDQSSWISPNYFRDLVNKGEKNDYDQAVKEYTAIPVNMRHQEYKTENKAKGIGFFRVGVMTDLTNGFTNLKFLKDLAKTDSTTRNHLIDQEIAKLDALALGKKNIGLKRKLFGTYSSPLKGNKLKGVLNAKKQLENIRNGGQALDVIIENRRAALRDQFAHLLLNQFEKNSDKIDPGKPFNIAHVLLLNPGKAKLDSTGWQQDEANEIADMQEIFAEFDNKEVILGDEFFIDSEGKIHLPKPANWDDTNGNTINLRTYFFNINVQGKTKGDQQSTILERSMEKLRTEDPLTGKTVQFQGLVKRLLTDKESNHDVAEDIALMLNNRGIPFSTGCLSAKDRTKVVGENIVRKFAINNNDMDEGSKQKIMDDPWKNPDNASSRVLKDTSGVRVAKFNPKWIGGKIGLVAKLIFAAQAIKVHVIKAKLGLNPSED